MVKVVIHANGSIDLHDKESSRVFTGLHVFEDCGDAGDTYNYSPVSHDHVITSVGADAQIEFTQSGPVFVEANIDLAMQVPVRLKEGDQERTKDTVLLPIHTRLRVYSGQKRVEFTTTVDNTAEDHRIRVLFPTGIHTDASHAETQFGTIQRDIRLDNVDWKKKKWHEKPLPIFSQQRYVALHDDTLGLAVLNRGLPEYEIYAGDGETIAVTLVRGVGMMGKSDLLIRPGRPSGIVSPTPDAQCMGRQTLEYAVYPYNGGDEFHTVPSQAAAFDAQALAVQSHLKYQKLMRKFGILMNFISLETLTGHVVNQLDAVDAVDMMLADISDARLLVSAVKKAEDEEALIIRLFNGSREEVSGARITLDANMDKGYLTDFNEENLEILDGKQGSFLIPKVKPDSAITLKFPIIEK